MVNRDADAYVAPTEHELQGRLRRILRRPAVVREAAMPIDTYGGVDGVIDNPVACEVLPQFQLRIEYAPSGASDNLSALFHIQQFSTPKLLRDIFTAVFSLDSITSNTLSARVALGEYTLKAAALPFLRQLGLIERQPGAGDAIRLTPWAKALRSTSDGAPGLLGEAIHLHLATRYHANRDMRASWAYATAVGHLWDRAPLACPPAVRDQLAAQIRVAGAAAYGLALDRVAFSGDSVRGVMHWLGALTPRVIEGRGGAVRIGRRTTCPVPAVWWAVGVLDGQAREDAAGGPVVVDDARRVALARLLFLEPTAVEPMLRLAAAEASGLSGEPCLTYDATRAQLAVVRRIAIGTLPGGADAGGS